MGSSYTVSQMVPFIVTRAVELEGVNPKRLFDLGLGSSPRPEEHIESSRYFEFWRSVVECVPDPTFPLRASSLFQLEDHEVFGFLAMSCETLGQAYERTAAYRALYCVGARWELSLEGDAARVIWCPWPGQVNDPGYRAAMDFAVWDMAKAIRQLGRTDPLPKAVRLAHDAVGATYADFYGVNPTFHAGSYELVYDASLQSLPIKTFNSRLRDYFDEECKRLVAELGPGQSILDQLRKVLISAMDGGDTSIEAIAKNLGLSARSLQRRLNEEGTRYNDVLNAVREEFAKRYLTRGSVSASEVAYLLGFTEPRLFSKPSNVGPA